ncbi:MAG: hypothetical protein JXR31_04915, partial [Prolixibacteraceae bacterium]|nr:hypothetical protein [Prolixibacteraceae bacterium]
MKKLFTFSVLTLLLSISVLAQIPQAFKYQAVLRDASGQVLANQEVVISVSILQGSALGAEVFAESHELATNGFGLVNLSIGEIEPIMFSSIDWSMGPYFVKIAVDGIEMGTSQLLSVPYALHAGSVENDMTEDADADPTNELQTWATLPGIPADIADGDDIEDADADPTNELQTWGTLPDIPADIANGDDVEDADADPLNELQVLSISNDTIFLENGGFVKLPSGFDGNYSSLSGTPENLSDFNNDLGFVTSAEDADADPTNELQDWSTLPGIPTDFADGDDVEDADADPANELQTWGTLPGIPADIADGDDVDDADADPTNELQDWSTLPGIPANIADGDDIEDADADSTNELNTNLELVGSFLKVTDNGGELSVDLSSLIDDNDSDPTNELQEWGTLPGIPDDIADGDDVDDADADPTNELQSWGTLPGIPADLIDGDDVDDADADPTNELNTNLELVGSILKVTDNGGELSVDLSSLIDDNDSDPTNELQEWGTLPGIPDDIADGDDLEDADADPSNELNTNLELVGSFLKVTDNGGELSVDLSSLINDNDSDPTNELQSWSTLPGIPADIADGDDVDDADSDPTNELQVWGTLPGIPNDIADGDDVEDADADPTNELNTNLELVGTFLKVTDNGGELSVDLSSLIDDNDSDPTNELQEWGTLPGIPDDIADGDDVEDADSDPTNELQSWGTLPGIPADLVDGDDVNDADADPTNELQDISLSGTELSITGGST